LRRFNSSAIAVDDMSGFAPVISAMIGANSFARSRARGAATGLRKKERIRAVRVRQELIDKGAVNTREW
jgi:hypothetical protein